MAELELREMRRRERDLTFHTRLAEEPRAVAVPPSGQGV